MTQGATRMHSSTIQNGLWLECLKIPLTRSLPLRLFADNAGAIAPSEEAANLTSVIIRAHIEEVTFSCPLVRCSFVTSPVFLSFLASLQQSLQKQLFSPTHNPRIYLVFEPDSLAENTTPPSATRTASSALFATTSPTCQSTRPPWRGDNQLRQQVGSLLGTWRFGLHGRFW